MSAPTLCRVKQAVIFDGDDTLWLTEPLYDGARAAARATVEAAGLNGARWEALERQIDVENVARMGHTPQRFPTSCVEALDALARESGAVADASLQSQVWAAAEQVFSAEAPPRPHARKVVAELAARGLKLALLTKGDRAVQERRISGSGLGGYFDVVEIVVEKSVDVFERIIQQLDVDPTDVLSVGNSIRSDVLPAIAAGVRPVWISAHVWEYERALDDLLPAGVATITDLDELLPMVPA
jgi:putative hydrolase of the HAD superfamily